jgi:Ceramidase
MSWILRSNDAAPFAPERKRIAAEALLTLALVAALALLLSKPIHQAASYHDFHDARVLLGVPNLLNVLSNLPFVAIGIAGLHWLAGPRHGLPLPLVRAYATLMAGTLLTGFGSAWYHYAPTHASLVWDRLPMAIAFMGLFAAMIGERLSLDACRWLLAPLVGFGIASVLYWQVFDDLRPYVLTQFFPLLTIPLLLAWLPPAYTRGRDIIMVLGVYVVAKGLEFADGAIFSLGHILSGHTLKHIAAAAGATLLLRMLQVRRPMANYGSSSVSQYK